MKAETSLCAYTDKPHEDPNNFLHPSGKLDGDHRLDLLLLPFLPSREEKEVGLRCRIPLEIPNAPLTLTRRIK